MQSPRDQSPIKRSSYHFLCWERSSLAEEALHMGIRPIPGPRLPRWGGFSPGRTGSPCCDVPAARCHWCHLLPGRFNRRLLGLPPTPAPAPPPRAAVLFPGTSCTALSRGWGAMLSDASTKITLWPRSRVHAQPLRQRKRGEEGSEAA